MPPIPLLENIKTAIVDPIIYFLFALAFIYFLWGVFEMIRNAESEEARKVGQQHILWGVIGMFIMISFYGIMQVICQTISC
ncbi:MAG TPA: hypothetical protein VJB69_00120 [Candidatus Paceibacterota bacterium]